MLPRYKYAPLPPDNIRLLRILDASDPDQIICSLETQPRDFTNYIALSYCWGDPRPVASIRISNERVDVPANLWSFLQSWSAQPQSIPTHSDLLWIDAICINQRNNQEKSFQVQQMWRIYENADLVVSWLGTSNESTSIAFLILNGISALGTPIAENSPKLAGYERALEDAEGDLKNLTHNDYFSRAWTYQEISSAKNVIFICGSDWCSFYHFDLLFGGRGPNKLLADRIPRIHMGIFLFLHGIHPHGRNHWTPAAALIYDAADTTLFWTIFMMKHRKCNDLRDRIFASLNLPSMRAINQTLNLWVDYSISISELFVVWMSCFDSCVAKSKRAWTDDNILFTVGNLESALGVDIRTITFQSWFRERLQHSATGNAIFIGGREVDCSGPILADLARQGPIFCKYKRQKMGIIGHPIIQAALQTTHKIILWINSWTT